MENMLDDILEEMEQKRLVRRAWVRLVILVAIWLILFACPFFVSNLMYNLIINMAMFLWSIFLAASSFFNNKTKTNA